MATSKYTFVNWTTTDAGVAQGNANSASTTVTLLRRRVDVGPRRFGDAGQSYVVTITSKTYTFPQSTRVITLNDSIDDLVFVANP